MNKLYLVLAIVLFPCQKALVTEQALDEIIINDTTFYLYSDNVLEPRWGYPLEPLIQKMYQDSAGSRIIGSMIRCNRWCIRGYVAKWEGRNDSLFLRKIVYGPPIVAYINGNYSADDSFPLEKLFPNRDTEHGILADWFTGMLRAISEESEYPSFSDNYWKGKRKALYVEKGLVKVCRSS